MANIDTPRAAISCVWWSEALGMHQNKRREQVEAEELREGVVRSCKARCTATYFSLFMGANHYPSRHVFGISNSHSRFVLAGEVV